MYIEGIGECEWRKSKEKLDSNGANYTEYTYYRGRDQYLNNITHLITNETGLRLNIF